MIPKRMLLVSFFILRLVAPANMMINKPCGLVPLIRYFRTFKATCNMLYDEWGWQVFAINISHHCTSANIVKSIYRRASCNPFSLECLLAVYDILNLYLYADRYR